MIGSTRLALGIAFVMSVVLGTASVAQAQYQSPPPGYYAPPPPGYYAPPPRYAYPPPPPPRRGMYRDGLVLGVGLGLGAISAQNCGNYCGGAGAFEFHIGGMIDPRVALMADVWFNGRSVPNSDASVVHTLYTFAVQFWPADIFWLKGGIGGGNMNVSSNIDGFNYGDENGLGLLGAAGVEFLQSGNFALDGQFRFGHGFYSQGGDVNVFAFMVGANWY